MESSGAMPTTTGNGALGQAAEGLRERLRGSLIMPEDDRYEDARKVWNGMIDKHPAMIARCAGPADVIQCMNFARELSLPVSVRGGGHNVAGTALCDGGLVIDLSEMRSVRIDPQRRRARVEAGARLRDLDHEAQAHGLAVPVGVVSRTGVAGLTLHGGMGLLLRKYGLASDNVVSADVVTADGRLLVADEDSHSDLLWALRGGGGSFGIVTSFEFQLHPVGPELNLALVLYPLEMAGRVLARFRAFMDAAPDEVMGVSVYWSAPDADPIPEDKRGAPVVVVLAAYSGPVEEGERVLLPLREIDVPIADLSGTMPYAVAQYALFDHEYPDGRRYYWKSIYLNHLNDDVIAVLSRYAANRPSPISSIDVWALGGAMGRVRPEATAFFKRDAPYMIGIEANWIDQADDAENLTWLRALYAELQSFSPGGAYLNFPGFYEEGEELIRTSYGGNYDRLRTIKAQYDPENLFGRAFSGGGAARPAASGSLAESS